MSTNAYQIRGNLSILDERHPDGVTVTIETGGPEPWCLQKAEGGAQAGCIHGIHYTMTTKHYSGKNRRHDD